MAMNRSEIMGENGIVVVTNAIETEIRDFKSDALRKAEILMTNFRELVKIHKFVLPIVGSQKLGVYQTDFGWGKPKNCEAAHIESSRLISLSDLPTPHTPLPPNNTSHSQTLSFTLPPTLLPLCLQSHRSNTTSSFSHSLPSWRLSPLHRCRVHRRLHSPHISLHVSTFVVTCSLIWVCLVGSEENKQDSDKLCYLMILVDSRDSPEFSLTSTYFGNCLTSCMVAMKRSEIVGENGIVTAAKTIEREIRDFKSALRKAENLMSDFKELEKLGKSVLVITSSPKLGVYQTDFGWGKPKKCEAAHVESSKFMSLSDCRDEKEGIEVGLALERTQMNKFSNILKKELHNINKF
ncbi:coumaroyl-CoA:anthocyanidin 3-O-glucoside-6''-O-coumaroyltransferase 1-like [Vigna unguiculata]|uniref:coumaroyl-CoA:anthocyanidin 3-O-glucoside-6''-O-coumaroyltransferase 1-like n=1 Tax=Vigna unguiculata TaxID=3917 RepID=UPI0010167191|nr:coumaroyl-CoA:anthocyanidin 3-O-glucoside-6''-O-coumaroyltransferase 1-like [Vigna unguiculata]